MTAHHRTYAGPAMGKLGSFSADNVVTALIREHPDADWEEITKLLIEKARASDDLLQAVFSGWTFAAYNRCARLINKLTDRPAMQAPPDEKIVALKAKIERAAVKMKVAAFVIATYVLPGLDGKIVSDSTDTELRAAGAGLERIADLLKPGQTPSQAGLSQEQMQRAWEGK